MIWSLQVLRFAAALMVVVAHLVFAAQHAFGWIGTIPKEIAIVGTAGVDLFFVLSGIVIAMTAPKLTASQFIWRRIRRILPIYFVCSLPVILVAFWRGFGWRDALATLLLWPATDVMTLPALHVGWTLAFEMLFYASAALALINRRWLYVLLAGFVLAYMLRSYGPPFQFLGNPLILEFLFGVGIAYAPTIRRGALLIPFGMILLLAAGQLHLVPTGDMIEYLTGEDSLQRVGVFGLPAAMIVYGAMHLETRQGVLTYLGGASYALYLTHPTVVAAVMAVAHNVPIHPNLFIALGTVACIVVAWRVHELIEKPILRALPRDQFSVTFGST